MKNKKRENESKSKIFMQQISFHQFVESKNRKFLQSIPFFEINTIERGLVK